MSDDAGVDDLSPEDVSALKELAEWWRSSKMGRRAVLGASAAGMGMAGALGAGVGTAAAQPSGDEGQVGQQGDRVEAWISEADANEIATVDLSAENALIWSEDSNSPHTEDNTASATYTFGGEFDRVLVFAHVEDVSGSTNIIDLRANGDTGSNYSYINAGGTQSSNETEVARIVGVGSNQSKVVRFETNGTWTNNWSGGATGSGASPSQAFGFSNPAVSSPLNSLTLIGDGNFNVTWRVYGAAITDGV